MTFDRVFRKQRKAAPGSLQAEAAGLAWLAEAERQGGARIARVLRVDDDVLELEQLTSARPTRDAARRFGAALAATHGAGADGFGAPPSGWEGACYLGRQELPVTTETGRWGAFYARLRVLPYLERARERGNIDARTDALVREVCDRLDRGDFDDDESPARLHGDLWNGNVVWTPGGVVLIDPAAHGGHRETDLAMLELFGCPELGAVLDAYDEARPLRAGWRDRVSLHQLHPLAVHAASHGPSYATPLAGAARAALAL